MDARLPKQMLLPGIAPAPQRNDRLSFAVKPDAETAAGMVQLAWRLRSAHRLQGRPIDAGRLHISLLLLGGQSGAPHALVALASRAASTIVLPPFAVSFDRVLSFSGTSRAPGGRAIVLSGSDVGAGLSALSRALAAAMREFGFSGGSQLSLTPHVTLLYDRQSVAERTIEPVTWTVREFVLAHSHIRDRRSYELLGRWALLD